MTTPITIVRRDLASMVCRRVSRDVYFAAAGAGAALQAFWSGGNQSVVASLQAFARRSTMRLPHFDGADSLTGLQSRWGSHEYAPQSALSPRPSAITVTGPSCTIGIAMTKDFP